MRQLVGVLLLALSAWQIYAARRAFKAYKKVSSKTDSPWRAFGYLYGYFFGGVLLVFGLLVFFGGFGKF